MKNQSFEKLALQKEIVLSREQSRGIKGGDGNPPTLAGSIVVKSGAS